MENAILLPARDGSKDFFSQSSSTLFEYLQKAGTVFVEEGDEVEKEAKAFFGLIEEHYRKALAKRGSVPAPDSVYLSPEELSLSLEKFQTFFLQEGPIAPPRCQRVFSFEMETNEDLRQEMMPSLSTKSSFHETSPFSFFIDRLRGWQEKGVRILIVSHTEVQAERLMNLLSHYNVVSYLEKPGRFRETLDQPEKPLIL
jgi:hypothetical protein